MRLAKAITGLAQWDWPCRSPPVLLQPCLTTVLPVACSEDLEAGKLYVTKIPSCRCDSHVLGKIPLCTKCARENADCNSVVCTLCNLPPQTLTPEPRDYPGEWLRRFLTCGECWGCPALTWAHWLALGSVPAW